MKQKHWRVIVLVLGVLLMVAAGSQQPPSNQTIGVIDFYGMKHVSVESLRNALPFKEGDGMHPPSVLS
jgi:hypothetical protein